MCCDPLGGRRPASHPVALEAPSPFRIHSVAAERRADAWSRDSRGQGRPRLCPVKSDGGMGIKGADCSCTKRDFAVLRWSATWRSMSCSLRIATLLLELVKKMCIHCPYK